MEKQQGATRDTIYEYAERQYGSLPEHLWNAFPLYSVFRRADNKKWYAIIMNIQRNKLGFDDGEYVDIIDVKCSPAVRDALLGRQGFLPAYHLSKKTWITVLLDGTVDSQTVLNLVDESYNIASGRKQKKTGAAASWLVPANPKYYDIEKAFSESDEILWKQSNSVTVGDTVYLYVAAPLSCVKYKCEAVEVDIPYEYSDDNLSMHKVMKLKRLYTYDNSDFDKDALKQHGVSLLRGPRRVPFGLRIDLEEKSENKK
ncbi:MAG: MmcQ/YjbR family DNA-binding protein [Clostridiales bacterium]|nr:MmcQ/YjbR family DNA-binding protein [Clostridiales bacterium]